MYYSSNQNSNEYYRSYKQNLSSIDSENGFRSSRTVALKRVGMALLFLSFIFTFIYLIQYFFFDNKLSLFSSSDGEKQQVEHSSPVATVEKNILLEVSNTAKSDEELDTTKIIEHLIETQLVKPQTDIKNHVNPPKTNETFTTSTPSEDVPKIVIMKDQLPKSIQLKTSESKMLSNIKKNATDTLLENSPSESPKHNAIKREIIALSETSNMNAEEIERLINIILAKEKESNQSSLEEELLKAEDKTQKIQTLQQSNHYNKVTLSSKENNSQNQLNKLDNNQSSNTKAIKLSKYQKLLKSEIATRSNEMRIIIVKEGDTLSKLSLKAYGNEFSYEKIYKANPEMIKNPNQIFIGQKIRIPQ